jgi:flagellar biogenesis protein FliO
MLIFVFEQPLSYHLLTMFIVILAIHLHVVYILNAVISMDHRHAHVWQHISVLHQIVVPNAQSILNVQVTKLV